VNDAVAVVRLVPRPGDVQYPVARPRDGDVVGVPAVRVGDPGPRAGRAGAGWATDRKETQQENEKPQFHLAEANAKCVALRAKFSPPTCGAGVRRRTIGGQRHFLTRP
jgi:hypothetical protein